MKQGRRFWQRTPAVSLFGEEPKPKVHKQNRKVKNKTSAASRRKNRRKS